MGNQNGEPGSVSAALSKGIPRIRASIALVGVVVGMLGAAPCISQDKQAQAHHPAAGQAARRLPTTLPTLTTAEAVHKLTPSQAEQHYPVRLRAVCVVCFAGWHGFFVNDGTTGVYVETRNQELLTSAIHTGIMLEIVGVTGRGEFAPVIDQSTFRILGTGPIPAPRPVSLDHLATGVEDGQWVAFEGTVRSAVLRDAMLALVLASGRLKIEVMTTPAGKDFGRLIGARVRIHGTVGPIFNQLRQIVGVDVYTPSVNDIRILQPAPADRFAVDLRQVRNIFEYTPGAAVDHLVRIRGVVDARWGQIVFISDGTQGASVLSGETTALAPGDLVEAVGYPVLGDSTHTIEDAIFRRLGTASLPQPKSVSAKEALSGDFESGLIRLNGRLVEHQGAVGQTTLLVDSGGTVFRAILPAGSEEQWLAGLRDGSQIQVTGICLISELQASRHYRLPKAFQVLMRSSDDIVILRSVSWWTLNHALLAFGLALAAMLLVLVWVIVLRRRVAQQTRLLRESEERFRHMALHDSLTGLATRLLLQDRLTVALESANRKNKGLAVLMLDLDRFKEINDTLGHAVGDTVLQVTADRIVGAVRASDTVARMGGDEFVVVLSDLSDSHDAAKVAENLVAVLSVPVLAGDREVPVSASIGVCSASTEVNEADELLKKADIALYRAKASGRNSCAIFTPEMDRAETV